MPILDQFSLHGRRATITGGSRGLGLEMARALAEAGAELIIVGSDKGSFFSKAKRLGINDGNFP